MVVHISRGFGSRGFWSVLPEEVSSPVVCFSGTVTVHVIVVISGRVSWSVRGGDWLCQLWLDEAAAGFEQSFGGSPDVAGETVLAALAFLYT